MEFDLENPLLDTSQSPFTVESDHLLSPRYIKSLKQRDSNFIVRQETFSLISQLCPNSEPTFSYLAVNYLDRFLSSQALPVPHTPKPWIYRLLAMSCFSLAAKMQKKEFSNLTCQNGLGFDFHAETVHRMEMLILGALQWRMRSITPFSFLHFFIVLFKLEDPPSKMALIARAREFIVKSQNDIEVLEFKPSVIAAAAVLSAVHDLFPVQFLSFHRDICGCSYVNKNDILRCSNAILKVSMEEGYESVVEEEISSSDSPVNVLDICIEHSSDSERHSKKRRIMNELAVSSLTQPHN